MVQRAAQVDRCPDLTALKETALRSLLHGVLAGLAVAQISPAIACSPDIAERSEDQVRSLAVSAFEKATVIVDAEIELPMSVGPSWTAGLMPLAWLRVVNVVKGDLSDSNMLIAVAYISSCDIALTEKGQRFRILLSGSGVFTASQLLNGPAVGDQAVFNAKIDEIAGSVRPREFVSFPGAVTPPLR